MDLETIFQDYILGEALRNGYMDVGCAIFSKKYGKLDSRMIDVKICYRYGC